MKLFLVLLFGALVCHGQRVRYDGHKVFRVNPSMGEHLELLRQLETLDEYNFWSDVGQKGQLVDIQVPLEYEYDFLDLMERNGINVEVFIDNLQDLISENSIVNTFAANMTWDAYYDLEGIHSWLDSLAPEYPQIVSVISAGRSYEGRNIKGIKISFGKDKRAVFIEGGIHAREWITPATVTYIINELLTSNDTDIRRIATSFDWYILPVTNPDGYVYTHTTDRVWRKTRKPYPQSLNCTGVDPNRNWDFYWGLYSTSTNSCSNTYGGPRAFSEDETSSLAGYIQSVSTNLDVYFSFHSYSQYLLIPYGNTTEPQGNFEDLLTIGTKGIEALTARHNTTYRVGNTAALMGSLFSGTTTDWVKDKFKIPIAYTYELRDRGRYGFILPPDQILPNGEEVMDSLVAIFLEAARLGYFPLEDRQYILNE